MVSKTLFSSKVSNWGTPLDLFDILNEEFSFVLDPATTPDNPLNIPHFFTEKENGLTQDWMQHTFVNPPFNENALWVQKASIEQRKHNTVVMLLANRTDTTWFHQYCYKKKDVDIIFLRGRLWFTSAKNVAPFGSMIVIFWGNRGFTQRIIKDRIIKTIEKKYNKWRFPQQAVKKTKPNARVYYVKNTGTDKAYEESAKLFIRKIRSHLA